MRTTPDYFETYCNICVDPATRYVLRNRIIADSERDPVDALHDAETLLYLARMRVAEMQEAATHPAANHVLPARRYGQAPLHTGR